MRKRYLVIAAVVVAVVAGAGYGLFVYPDQVVRSALDDLARKLPDGATFTYKDAHYSILHRTLMLHGLAIHLRIAGDTPNGANIAIDSFTVDHPATDAADGFARLQTNPGSITPQTRIPIADAMILKGVRLWTDVAPLSSTTEWLGIYKLSIYPWVLLHEGRPAFDQMQASLAAGAPSSQALPLLQFYSAMLLGLRYDAYNERNLYVTLPGPADTPYANTPIKLGTHKLDASYKLGTQSNATLDGFIAHAEPFGTLTSTHVDLPDFDIRETLLLMINGDSLGQAAEKMKIGPVQFAGVSVTPVGHAAVPLGDAVLSRFRFDQGRLVSGAVALNSVRIRRNDLCDLLAGADCGNDLLPEQMTVTGQAGFTRDIAQDRLSLVDTGLKLNGLGSASLEAEFTDVAEGPTFMAAARLAHASFHCDNLSLMERLLTMHPDGIEARDVWQRLITPPNEPVTTAPNQEAAAPAGQTQGVTVAFLPSAAVPLSQLWAELSAPGAAPAGLTVAIGHR